MKNGEILVLEEPLANGRKPLANSRKPLANSEAKDSEGSLTFIEMLQSTLWALLGVQKPGNHSRDFSRGNPLHFIYMGVGFTVFFVVLLIGIVQLALMAVD